MSPAGPWDELRREVERLLGMPPGSSLDPLGIIRKDAQRFEQVLGEGFVDIRFMADSVAHRLEAAMDAPFPESLFEIPKRLLQVRPPGLNGFQRR